MVTGGVLVAQEKKNEQRIKIIAVDKTGTKIQIDTLIKGGTMMDTLILKDGKVIVVRSHGAKAGTLTHVSEGKGNIFVTVSSDEEGNNEIVKEIQMIHGDSVRIIKGGKGEKIIIMKDGAHVSAGEVTSRISFVSKDGESKSGRYIYVSEGNKSIKEGEKTFDVKVITDEKDNKMEMTKYVIAKDGMVISIEGNDEAKVKDLIKDIEAKLGVSKEDKNVKQVIKEEPKKTKKK